MSIHLNTRVSRRHFIGGTTALALSPTLRSFAADEKTETWAFLSDTHIHADPAFVSRNETNLADNLKRVVAEVMAEKESLNGILVDGDCAFNAGLPGDYKLFAEIIAPLMEANLPIHMTMGNHDDRGPFFDVFSGLKSAKPPVESKHVGFFESSLVNFVFLDSLRFVNKTEGEFGEQQLAWLTKVLDENPDKPTLLIGHHYPQVFREDVIPSDKPIKISGLVDSEPFLELIGTRPQAKAYVYGHSHTWGVKSDEVGFHQINLPPTSYVFDVKRPNGWVKAKISETGMELELSALDKAHPEHAKVQKLAWRA